MRQIGLARDQGIGESRKASRETGYGLMHYRALAAVLIMTVGAGGCTAPMFGPRASQATPPRIAHRSEPAIAPAAAPPAVTLATIVTHDLQNGRYAEGEKALRRYLQEHPGDRATQFFLRQLTENPKQMLGSASMSHVVQQGDSYSSLAARYLGDPNLFVVLARYNGSTNPSLIHVGSTLRLPLARSQVAPATSDASARAPAGAVATSSADPALHRSIATDPPTIASSAQRADVLRDRSIVLYRQGHKDQALTMLDNALTLDPRLTSSDPAFTALRQAWVVNCHQQAMVFYLDQQLDQAVALWNRILTVDPGYEPALVYRTRALELKQRLNY